jgi:hypothetical protein
MKRRMLTKRNPVGFRGRREKKGYKAARQSSQARVPALEAATITSRRKHNVSHERSVKGSVTWGLVTVHFFRMVFKELR